MSKMQNKFNFWFLYDEKTGKLFWKKTKNFRAVKGSVAGCVDKSFDSPRCVVRLDGQKHHLSRVIWCMLYGDIKKGMVLDHINGDPMDNRLSNLRLTTPAENAKNRKKHTSNTTGITGVCKGTPTRGCERWRAQIHNDGVFFHLGTYSTKEEAAAARIGAEKVLGFLSHKRNSQALEGTMTQQ